MTTRYVGLILSAVVAVFLAIQGGCADRELMRYLRAKHPGCEVLKIEDKGLGYTEATLQCGPLPKKVTVRRTR